MHTTRRYVTAMLTGALTLAATGLVDNAAAARERSGTAAAAPVVRVEAENRTAQRGTATVAVPRASGGFVVAGISDGNWLRYDSVAVDRVTTTHLCFTADAERGAEVATVDVRIGSRWATPVQSIVLRNFLGTGVRQSAFGGVAVPDGVHTVFLTVRQPRHTRPFELDYVGLYSIAPPPTLSC
jgi:hypothetical protein